MKLKILTWCMLLACTAQIWATQDTAAAVKSFYDLDSKFQQEMQQQNRPDASTLRAYLDVIKQLLLPQTSEVIISADNTTGSNLLLWLANLNTDQMKQFSDAVNAVKKYHPAPAA